jgi:hypothetical protein
MVAILHRRILGQTGVENGNTRLLVEMSICPIGCACGCAVSRNALKAFLGVSRNALTAFLGVPAA